MLGWMKHKLQSRLPGEISITSDTQKAKKRRVKVKEESEPEIKLPTSTGS